MTEAKNKISRSGPSCITKAVQLLPDGASIIATSRRHRKGRGPVIIKPNGDLQTPQVRRNPWLRFWAPHKLTWWVAVLFIIGSVLFSAGGYFNSFPREAPAIFNDSITIDWIFCIGSLFFTGAAFCQLPESIFYRLHLLFDCQPIGFYGSMSRILGLETGGH